MVKTLPAHEGDTGDTDSIPGLGRSPRVGNGTPLQYASMENSMNREAWLATVYGVTKRQKRLNTVHIYTQMDHFLRKNSDKMEF